MRFLKAPILTLNLFCGLTPAQPSTPPLSTDGQLIEGQPMPDGWHAVHLDGSESSFAALEASADANTTAKLTVCELIKVCESGLFKLAQCAMVGSFVNTITAGIAGVIWGQGKQKSCTKISGNLNGLRY
ncbi:hypothetical protein N7457_001202 [Penicillium paradoxum]|uniref:uncharacterized protein n=1 Tax=Penicillium paradoxum TaxID=176176 RepID=UPI002546DAF6|nr:uncharacterized protein N7457_001202 [Penicillium paradoxum]KAJ5794603.1 hypothetical protein N7457_001202 [Penicillium paradoxum]